ncbi:MAG: hypothetical protein SNJ63_00610 [Sphingomonadaceae bacterium]
MTGKARLRVTAAGSLVSWQDRGRFGHARFGVSPSGPVDRQALSGALAAAQLAEDAPAIEIAGGGLSLLGEGSALGFALAGPLAALLDGVRLDPWCTGTILPGSRLDLRLEGGNWGYLALAGNPCVQRWLGSASTHAASGLGGGRLQSGDVIPVTNCRALDPGPLPLPPEAAPIATVRVVPGPQERHFPPDALAQLTNATWRPTAAFDRMGLRLSGPAIPPLSRSMPSEPIVRGALQVDGAGDLTLLLADHQTTGGYPRLATVIGQDADRLAQLPPGTPFHFEAVSPEAALALARAHAAGRARWLEALRCRQPLAERLLATNLVTA